jgi:hypothetical protein
MNGLVRRVLAPWLLATGGLIWSIGIGACDAWPRHAHLPKSDDGTLAAGSPPAAAIEVEWSDLGSELEPNDGPDFGQVFGIGEGWILEGEMTGTGWDPDLIATGSSECGASIAFPPAQPGAYVGDVDWFAFTTEADATVCIRLTLDDPDISFDFPLYLLNECAEPSDAFVDADSGAPLGVGSGGGSAVHVLHVPGGSAIGMALAGYWPDDLSTTAQWRIEGAVVPLVAGAGDDLCPDPQGRP